MLEFLKSLFKNPNLLTKENISDKIGKTLIREECQRLLKFGVSPIIVTIVDFDNKTEEVSYTTHVDGSTKNFHKTTLKLLNNFLF